MNSQRLNNGQANTLTTELALLGFLRRRRMHGYEIHQLLSDSGGLNGVWKVKLSRLYAMLNRLEAEGLVEAHVEPQRDRPPRKMLGLTAAGEKVFLAWVTTPVTQPRDLRLAFMLKLYFAQQESREAVSQLVSKQQSVCDEWLGSPLVLAVQDGNFQDRAVHRFRLGQIEAIRSWLAWLGNELEVQSS